MFIYIKMVFFFKEFHVLSSVSNVIRRVSGNVVTSSKCHTYNKSISFFSSECSYTLFLCYYLIRTLVRYRPMPACNPFPTTYHSTPQVLTRNYPIHNTTPVCHRKHITTVLPYVVIHLRKSSILTPTIVKY